MHDRIAQIVHWKLCQEYNLVNAENWYDHKPERVLENESIILWWDFKLQTNKVLQHTGPDMTVLQKENHKCLLLDISCPFDTKIQEKEQEKAKKC